MENRDIFPIFTRTIAEVKIGKYKPEKEVFTKQ
jgi:hypothetical protein